MQKNAKKPHVVRRVYLYLIDRIINKRSPNKKGSNLNQTSLKIQKQYSEV